MSRFYYYAASVWPRYGDTLVTFVALKPGLAEEAAAKAAEFEVNERWQYDEQGHADGRCFETGCPYCDLINGCESRIKRNYLFSAKELNECRRALVKGEVVALYP